MIQKLDRWDQIIQTLTTGLHIKVTCYVDLPLQYVCSVFNKRCLHITSENKKLTGWNKSCEYINQESAVPWTVITVSDTTLHKT
jgi:hypothetical protein